MGIFDFFQTGGKAVDTVSDIAKDGMDMLDNAFYTDQEKSEKAGQMFDAWLRMQEVIGNQKSPTAVSRRIVAWGVASLVWIAVVFCLVLIGIADDDPGVKVIMTTEMLDAVYIGPAFVSMIAFYFGPHLVHAFFDKGK